MDEIEMEKELNKLGKSKDWAEEFKKSLFVPAYEEEYRKKWNFPNGYGISVIRGFGSYGQREGLFEIALLKNGSLTYDKGDFKDVIGYLTPEKVVYYAKKIHRKRGRI